MFYVVSQGPGTLIEQGCFRWSYGEMAALKMRFPKREGYTVLFSF